MWDFRVSRERRAWCIDSGSRRGGDLDSGGRTSENNDTQSRCEIDISRLYSSNLSTSSWPGSEAMMSDSNRTEQRDSIRTQRLRPRARVASPSWSFVNKATRRAKVQGSTPDDDCRYEYSSQTSRMLSVRYSIDQGSGTVYTGSRRVSSSQVAR